MSIDHVRLNQLRNDLALRPLSAEAVRAAHALASSGEERFAAAYKELAAAGLARCMASEEGGWFRPTGLLLDLWASNRMDLLAERH